MRVGIIPRYQKWGASSRLRAYALADGLKAIGHSAWIGFDGDEDVLVVQKSPDHSWIERAKEFKRRGGRVVFDFDDREVYHMLPYWKEIVHRFITDTEGHAEESGVGAVVVPDAIDFPPPQPLPPTKGDGVVWYAASITYPCAERWVHELADAGIKVRVISHTDRADVAGPNIEFVKWDMDTFVGELQKSAVAILSHVGGMNDPGKSNDKMTLMITHGLPCLVSDTPEYAKLAREIQQEWTIVRDGESIVDKYHKLMESRETYLETSQWYVWHWYHPNAIAQLWLEVIE